MSAATLGELNEKQVKALAALLSHSTVPAAAKACGVGASTLFRYLQDETFKAHYRLARAEVVGHAITQLQRDCSTASETLREVCEDKQAPASARVSAARAIIDGAVKAVEQQDLTARMEELEKTLAASRQGSRR